MKIDCYNNVVILNPKISKPARLLWAVLQHWEQEGKGDMKIGELVAILGVTGETVFRYLDELRRKGCLDWSKFTGLQFTTVSSMPHSKAASGKDIFPIKPSNPHLN